MGMKKIACGVALALVAFFSPAGADEAAVKDKVILLIAEQNIAGPQCAWWASEIDLSTVESAVAAGLIDKNYDVVQPVDAAGILKQERAFRVIGLSDRQAAEFGKRADAEYIVKGKALASEGGRVPHSEMRSYYANITARLIRVSDGKVLKSLSVRGSSAHVDAVTGGSEALEKAGRELAARIVEALHNQGAKQ